MYSYNIPKCIDVTGGFCQKWLPLCVTRLHPDNRPDSKPLVPANRAAFSQFFAVQPLTWTGQNMSVFWEYSVGHQLQSNFLEQIDPFTFHQFEWYYVFSHLCVGYPQYCFPRNVGFVDAGGLDFALCYHQVQNYYTLLHRSIWNG